MTERRAYAIETLLVVRDLTLDEAVKRKLITKQEAQEWTLWDQQTREASR